ncbi:Mitochondrial import receptor subunit TOM20-4 [Arabidopsis thaliana]|uniref:TOM20-4 n=4 Tax=Arabidopsis TaxID=3701 RepID=A0A178UR07_ARATH|nr:Tetratricopeptide-like helical domain superfamily [Arabidopsis thaliana x Arabidopsis arenosa]KAG7611394.1 Tetratricopeptide-like helical domain superfamily [Arabidopsis suecica]OAO96093.1 TOM20-4 [Arabidopsis thaliana]CAA0406652.1 unnamed protein product [Arabidopsis thaliana]VYS68879.1 unnamed protein product [Arabidopsis thaliana]
MDMQNENERLMVFEHARKVAEATYVKNPLDAENLTRWAGALLELSQFQTEPKQMILEAILKLGEALVIDPKKHDALWLIGNAHLSFGFLSSDQTEARDNFEKASQFFQLAVEEQPESELYRKSLTLASKAPELHTGGTAGPSSNSAKTMKQKKTSEFKYDVFGWVILASYVVAWISFANSQTPVSRQ